MCELIRIDVRYDLNDDGKRRWLVTPYYRRNGRLVSVPDSRGWPTRTEALAEAAEIEDHNMAGV